MLGCGMSRPAQLDPLPHLAAVSAAVRTSGQPEATFRALDAAVDATLGHKLFTCLLHHPAARESERRYTNQPEAYPVGGRKPVAASPWAPATLRGATALHRLHRGRHPPDLLRPRPDHLARLRVGPQPAGGPRRPHP